MFFKKNYRLSFWRVEDENRNKILSDKVLLEILQILREKYGFKLVSVNLLNYGRDEIVIRLHPSFFSKFLEDFLKMVDNVVHSVTFKEKC